MAGPPADRRSVEVTMVLSAHRERLGDGGRLLVDRRLVDRRLVDGTAAVSPTGRPLVDDGEDPPVARPRSGMGAASTPGSAGGVSWPIGRLGRTALAVDDRPEGVSEAVVDECRSREVGSAERRSEAGKERDARLQTGAACWPSAGEE
ncbi:hypothetical protein [Halohasta salina]|uniref:hypothetical protein n=1 Tax=Halohasta salina TaxID=2961621 RepID=UPI0020A4E93E|nr:hypothetical protein [Halohasta salina]